MINIVGNIAYASTTTPITQIDLSNLTIQNTVKKLLVIVNSSYQSAYSKEDYKDWLYFNYGKEIVTSGVMDNTPTFAARVYVVDLDRENLRFTDLRCYSYQVWGIEENDYDLIKKYDVMDAPGQNIPELTSIDLSDTNFDKYSKLLVIIGYVAYIGVGNAMTDHCYITDKSPNGYSSNYKDSYSSSHLVRGYIITPNDVAALSSLKCQFYFVLGFGYNHINATGDITAIRDWFESTRYLNQEVEKYFIENNLYMPYNLTIITSAGSTVTLTGQTSLKQYVIKMINESITKLFFFEANETVTVTDGSFTTTKVLSDQNDTIRLVPDISAITRVDQYTELGDYSYTIPEDGTYLLVLSSGAGYDPSTVSYILPNGRSEIVSDVVTQSDGTYGYQMRYMIANLKENDIVQTNTFRTTGQYAWPSMINALYKIDGLIVDPDITCELTKVSDGTASYMPPSSEDKFLEIGIAYSGWNYQRNDTNLTGKDPEIVVEESVGYQSLIAMYYGEGSKLPTISMYGYNGGGGVVACLKIANKRADYNETVLWDYVTDNNGNLKDGVTYDLTLHDYIENYDYIILEALAYANDVGTQWDTDNFIKIPVRPLMNGFNPGKLWVATGNGIWKDRATVYELGTNHVKKVYSNYQYPNSMNAAKVIGVNMAYTETLLWDYVRDNNSNIVYDTTAITLAQSIDNFDELIIELLSYANDATDPNWNSTLFYTISVEALKSGRNPNYFAYTSYDQRSSRFYVSGTTFQKTTNNGVNINGIVRVYGINH